MISFRIVQDGQNVDHFRSLGIIDLGSGVTRFSPVQMLLGAGISRLKIVIVQAPVPKDGTQARSRWKYQSDHDIPKRNIMK